MKKIFYMKLFDIESSSKNLLKTTYNFDIQTFRFEIQTDITHIMVSFIVTHQRIAILKTARGELTVVWLLIML